MMSFRTLQFRFIAGSVMFMVAFSLAGCRFNKSGEGKYGTDTKAYIPRFEYTFRGGENMNITLDTPYSDSWFTLNPGEYNHNLCLASFAMAVSSFTASPSEKSWGDDECNREANIKQLYRELGFSDTQFFNYDVPLNDISSKVGYSFAMRTVYANAERVPLVNISIRGGGYGCEWADNFNVGSSSDMYHTGFKNCASDVKANLDRYISLHTQSDSAILWINGFSRGGAVANILASMYADEERHVVYAYTFASPATVTIPYEQAKKDRYNTIFNIINPLDPICDIPPEDWGFIRFGRDIPLYSGEKNNSEILAEYKSLTGFDKEEIISATSNVLLDILKSLCDTSDKFNSMYSESTKEFIVSVMSRERNSEGKWVRIGAKKYLIQKYGTKAIEAINASQSCAAFRALEAFDIKLPEELLIYNAILRMHGHTAPEDGFVDIMTLENLNLLTKLSSGEIGFEEVVAHYPETYISALIHQPHNKLP